jgi:hypothetical protein
MRNTSYRGEPTVGHRLVPRVSRMNVVLLRASLDRTAWLRYHWIQSGGSSPWMGWMIYNWPPAHVLSIRPPPCLPCCPWGLQYNHLNMRQIGWGSWNAITRPPLLSYAPWILAQASMIDSLRPIGLYVYRILHSGDYPYLIETNIIHNPHSYDTWVSR